MDSRRRATFLAFAICILATPWRAAFATVLDVSIDTTSLSGTAAQLASDLIDGDGAVNNTVTITSFSTDGTLGAATPVGGVTGALPGTVTIEDTDFFNELLQEITFGTTIDFTLDLTQNFAGGFLADQFSFFLLDPISLLPLFTTTDPLGTDALFAIDINGTASGDLQEFTATSSPAATWSVNPVSVPEPSSVALVGIGLVGLGACRRRGQRNTGIRSRREQLSEGVSLPGRIGRESAGHEPWMRCTE